MIAEPVYSPSFTVVQDGQVVGTFTRAKALRLIWRHTHRDYKGVINGVRSRIVHGSLVPLDALTDADIKSVLGDAVRAEVKRMVKAKAAAKEKREQAARSARIHARLTGGEA